MSLNYVFLLLYWIDLFYGIRYSIMHHVRTIKQKIPNAMIPFRYLCVLIAILFTNQTFAGDTLTISFHFEGKIYALKKISQSNKVLNAYELGQKIQKNWNREESQLFRSICTGFLLENEDFFRGVSLVEIILLLGTDYSNYLTYTTYECYQGKCYKTLFEVITEEGMVKDFILY